MKSSRAGLPKSVGLPPSYHAFFSFPVKKSGYSGVATYVRLSAALPLKAEEGLTGLIQPKPPLLPEERVSCASAYPEDVLVGSPGVDEMDFKDLDSEGRVIVVDLGLFVLINVYCPNDGNGTEERDKYKMDFHRVLEARVKGLIEGEGREVIVVGDINACAAVQDHCEGHLMVSRGLAAGMTGEEGFWEKDSRHWLKDWIGTEDGSGGPMIDIVRKFWPDRKGMYTCWNTKLSARDSNYGTRIDYILITRGLIPWVKFADIQADVKGSDHCPVYLDLHDTITVETGEVLVLREMLVPKNATSIEPPRLASKFWDEYSGKQRSLDSFFLKKGQQSTSSSSSGTPTPSESSVAFQNLGTQASLIATESPLPLLSSPPVSAPSVESSAHTVIDLSADDANDQDSAIATPSSSLSSADIVKQASTTLKRKSGFTPSQTPKKSKTGKDDRTVGQTKLSSFFNKPSNSTPVGVERSELPTIEAANDAMEVDEEADRAYALSLAEEINSSMGSSQEHGKKKQAWTELLAPVQPPRCQVHGELTKQYTVTKPGPNKGKTFFICSRPVGPGYDKGRTERLREEVDPQWRCNFFKWTSDVRRETRKEKGKENS
ncbi:hypothetical protein AX16_005828 [Volvariella volvacea WC 439]|nr:hypothetical protein AX16_005828 [Volvariella volvacea WC 439]